MRVLPVSSIRSRDSIIVLIVKLLFQWENGVLCAQGAQDVKNTITAEAAIKIYAPKISKFVLTVSGVRAAANV